MIALLFYLFLRVYGRDHNLLGSIYSALLIVYAIDVSVMSHKKGPVSVKSALKWVGVWVSIALLFGFSLYFFFPQNDFSEIHTGKVMMTKFIAWLPHGILPYRWIISLFLS